MVPYWRLLPPTNKNTLEDFSYGKVLCLNQAFYHLTSFNVNKRSYIRFLILKRGHLILDMV